MKNNIKKIFKRFSASYRTTRFLEIYNAALFLPDQQWWSPPEGLSCKHIVVPVSKNSNIVLNKAHLNISIINQNLKNIQLEIILETHRVVSYHQ